MYDVPSGLTKRFVGAIDSPPPSPTRRQKAERSRDSIDGADDGGFDPNLRIETGFLIFYLQSMNDSYRAYVELCIYMPFLVFFFLSALDAGSSLLAEGYWMTQALQDRNLAEFDQGQAALGSPFGFGLYFEKTWIDSVHSTDEFYHWAYSSPTFQGLFGNPDDYVKTNKLLDPVRIMQWRSKTASSCPDLSKFLPEEGAQYYSNNWQACVDRWDSGDPQTSDINALDTCGTDYVLGSEGYSGFKWMSSFSTLLEGSPNSDGKIEGFIGSYPIDQAYFFDLHWTTPTIPATWPTTLADPVAKLQCMQRSNWIDTNTRAIAVIYNAYNPAADLFTTYYLFAEISPAGGWQPNSRTFTFRWTRFEGITAIFDMIIVAYLIYYIIIFFWHFYIYFKEGRLASQFFLNLWTYVDAINIGIFVFIYTGKIQTFFEPDLQLVVTPDSPAAVLAYPKDEQIYWLNIYNYARLTEAAFKAITFSDIQSINGLLSFIKIFKYVSFSPHLNTLTQTMRDSFSSLLTLILYIIIITSGFAVMALLLYGNAYDRFESLSRAFGSLFRMILGDFDFEALREVNYTWTPIFFITYMIVLWLVILNMVIAIISEAFAKISQQRANGVRGFSTFILQKSSVRKVLDWIGWNTDKLEQKTKSPIVWNKIHKVPLTEIIRVLIKIRKGTKNTPGKELIGYRDIADSWNKISKKKKYKGQGPNISDKLFRLVYSTRDSIHTAIFLYQEHRDKQEKRRVDIWSGWKYHGKEDEELDGLNSEKGGANLGLGVAGFDAILRQNEAILSYMMDKGFEDQCGHSSDDFDKDNLIDPIHPVYDWDLQWATSGIVPGDAAPPATPAAHLIGSEDIIVANA